MRILIAVAIALSSHAYAGSDQALNNLQQEYVECFVYFTLVSKALAREGEQEAAKKYTDSATTALVGAYKLAQNIGLNDEALEARTQLSMQEMRDRIDDNFVNMSILFRDYSKPCVQGVEDPEKRIQYWLEQEAQ